MSITVADAYQLNILSQARILTGQSGFKNLINRMGILDYEFITDRMEGEFIKNDFVLSSFLFAKDDINLLMNSIRYLIDSGVSLLGVKDVYYDDLPAEIIDYAREKDFSIFLFGSETYFENIITEITDALRMVDSNQLVETKIDSLMDQNISKSVVRELAMEINPHFHENFFVAYCKNIKYIDDGSFFRMLDKVRQVKLLPQNNSIFKYQSGLLFILTYRDPESISQKDIINQILNEMGVLIQDYYIGISNFFSNLNELALGVQESVFAGKAGELDGHHISLYSKIGIHQLLIPYADSYWMQKFTTNIIEPLKAYDKKYSTEIFNSVLCYIENECNIKKSATALFQHENTIRYRVNKAREILFMENDPTFEPQLYLAIKLYKISDL